ncbi:MAG: hypothetical protein QXU11_10680 [Thermoproteota archaeon]
MRPELRKRFVDSIEYLRKMEFFQDYSYLSSEEILDRIFSGKINYVHCWWWEWKKKQVSLWGQILKESIERNEDLWMKSSDAEIDHWIIPFDTKRTVEEKLETIPDKEMGIVILNRLAKISRNVFQPMNISSEWLTPLGSKWSVQEVSFEFKGKRYSIEIVLRYDYIVDMGLRELNELIGDTGYKYYQIEDEDITVVVLTEEKLRSLERREDGASSTYFKLIYWRSS